MNRITQHNLPDPDPDNVYVTWDAHEYPTEMYTERASAIPDDDETVGTLSEWCELPSTGYADPSTGRLTEYDAEALSAYIRIRNGDWAAAIEDFSRDYIGEFDSIEDLGDYYREHYADGYEEWFNQARQFAIHLTERNVREMNDDSMLEEEFHYDHGHAFRKEDE